MTIYSLLWDIAIIPWKDKKYILEIIKYIGTISDLFSYYTSKTGVKPCFPILKSTRSYKASGLGS